MKTSLKLEIERGWTFRFRATSLDDHAEPIHFTDSVVILTPDDESFDPIELNAGNGKLALTQFNWKGPWSNGISYVETDVVRYGQKLWIAQQANLNSAPFGGENWLGFHSIELLISHTETAGFAWSAGMVDWRRVEGSGDVTHRTGRVKVSA